jgi:hypothetical protein
MVDKVKCRNQECKLFEVAVPVTNLYINRVAPLDGLWPCPVCGEEMKVAHVIPQQHEGEWIEEQSKTHHDVTAGTENCREEARAPQKREAQGSVSRDGQGSVVLEERAKAEISRKEARAPEERASSRVTPSP